MAGMTPVDCPEDAYDEGWSRCGRQARGGDLAVHRARGFGSGAALQVAANTATFDEHGNVYSGGTVWDFYGGSLPVTKGAFQTTFGGVWDVALLKFDSTGHDLLYGTYLGGSDTETPLSLIVNHKDELVILGITGSDDFPVPGHAYSSTFSGGDSVTNAIGNYNSTPFQGVKYLHGSDFFIATLSTDGGSLLSATYLGGTGKEGINNAPGLPLSRNYGDEFRGEVNVDRNNNVYIISNTSSPDFPIRSGFFLGMAAFIAGRPGL